MWKLSFILVVIKLYPRIDKLNATLEVRAGYMHMIPKLAVGEIYCSMNYVFYRIALLVKFLVEILENIVV